MRYYINLSVEQRRFLEMIQKDSFFYHVWLSEIRRKAVSACLIEDKYLDGGPHQDYLREVRRLWVDYRNEYSRN